MPRKKLLRTTVLPYHLTARVNNRDAFPVPLPYAWKVLTGELFIQALNHGIKPHAFVMMPNHFHLIATFPAREVDVVMKEVLASTTRIVNTKAQRSGHLFGGRYHWSLIGEAAYYAHALKYVYRNPVKAGICANAGDYPYSTYSGAIGKCPLPIPLLKPAAAIDCLVPEEQERLDAWLNQGHPTEQNEAIRKALRRKEFCFPVQRSNRRRFEFPL